MAEVTDSTTKKEIALKALEKRNAAEEHHDPNTSSNPQMGEVSRKDKSKILKFFSNPSKPDGDATGIFYVRLTHPVHKNLLTTAAQSDCHRTVTVSKALHEVFLHGDSAVKYVKGSTSTKMNSWLHISNFTVSRKTSKNYHISALKNFSKRSKEHISRKQHKKCGSFNLPQEIQKFDVFKPMHEMWDGYMRQVLINVKKDPMSVAQTLLNADLHGAIIIVAECKATSFTGVRGIMIRETAETFGIITEDDKLRVVPKKISVFIFQVYQWKITLHGDKLTSRNLTL